MTQLLKADEYIKDLIQSIKNAQHQISLIALVITDDSSTDELIDEIVVAARRGVQVRVSIDIFFTYRELDDSKTRASYLREQLKSMRITKKRLERAGVKVRWLGSGGIFLFSRRTHTKWSIVDDTVYAFGGVNLYSEGIANSDFMLKVESSEIARQLIDEQTRIIASDKAGNAYRSHKISTDIGDILIDGGIMGDSIIYRHACRLAEEATKITYISQYCPTGKLSRILKKRQSSLYFNHWKIAESLNRALIYVSMHVQRQNTKYKRKNYIHAKYMLFTYADGSKKAITGSHNFVYGGVLMGTREVALETSDAEIISLLEKFSKEKIA